jgi:hypothetical protein
MSDTKFHDGDQVRVIKGCKYWDNNGNIVYYNEDTVGSIGIISQTHKLQNIDYYSLEPIIKKGLNLKHAWYHNDELELIN